jgi:hypothetical protein
MNAADKDKDKKAEENMCGFLFKRGELNKSWKWRWFTVRPQDGGWQLVYFAAPPTDAKTKPKGSIPLERSFVRLLPADGDKFPFELITRARIFYFYAKTAAERDLWVERLDQISGVRKENEWIIKAEEVLLCSSEFQKYTLHLPANVPERSH